MFKTQKRTIAKTELQLHGYREKNIAIFIMLLKEPTIVLQFSTGIKMNAEVTGQRK